MLQSGLQVVANGIEAPDPLAQISD